MLIFFDYLCYWFYLAYKKGGDSSPEFLAGSVVATLQTFNICFLIMLYYGITTGDGGDISKSTVIVVFIILVIANYVRYLWLPKFSIEAIATRWDLETVKYRKTSRYLQLLYITLSSGLFLGIALYYGIPKMR